MDQTDQFHRDAVESTPCRRFTILDGMILIVGVSLWLAQTRRLVGDIEYEQVRLQPAIASNQWNVGFAVSFLALTLNSLAFMFIPIYMIVRTCQPRPPLWFLMWQPGMLASLIVLFYHSLLLFFVLVSYLIHSVLYLSFCPSFGGPGLPYVPGLLVACGWLAAKLMGRFRPERGWIEQLGRALGLGWIAAGILLYVIERCL